MMVSLRALTGIIALLKKRATHFHHSILARQHLRNIQKELWLLHVFQRPVEQKRALKVYAGEHREFACPSAFQWAIVSDLVKTLIPVEEVTLEESHHNTPASCIRMKCPQQKVLEH